MELAHSGVCMWRVEATLGTWVSHCTSLKTCVKRTGRLIGTGGRRLAAGVRARRAWERSRLELVGESVASKEEGMGPQARDEHPCGKDGVLGPKWVDQPGCFHQGERTQGRQTGWESTPGALGSRPGRRGQYLPPQQPCYGSSMGSLCGAALLSSYMFALFSLPARLSPFCIRTWAPSFEEAVLFPHFVSFSMVVSCSLPGFEPWLNTYLP